MWASADIRRGEKALNIKGNFDKLDSIEITCPDYPAMLTGLKIMALAQSNGNVKAESDSYTGELYEVFLRCDYRALADKKIRPVFRIEEGIRFLPAETQKLLLRLDRELQQKGFRYDANYLCYRTHYLYRHKKRGTLLSVNISPVNGCIVKINAEHIHLYPEFVAAFPPALLELIEKGYDCAKKEDPSACNPKCSGYEFDLGGQRQMKCKKLNFYIPTEDPRYAEIIEAWVGKELAYL